MRGNMAEWHLRSVDEEKVASLVFFTEGSTFFHGGVRVCYFSRGGQSLLSGIQYLGLRVCGCGVAGREVCVFGG